MKLPRTSYIALKNRLSAWNKYLRIGVAAAIVGLISLSVMLVNRPDKPVALSPAKTTVGQIQKVAQVKDASVTEPASENTANQTAQTPVAANTVQPQSTAKSTSAPAPAASTAKPRDTSTALPPATIKPYDPNAAPGPFYEVFVGSGAVNGDSVNLNFYAVPHNNPATDTSAIVVWIESQGQAPDYVYVRDVHMTSATTGVLTIGLSGNYPRSFKVSLVVNSSYGMGSVTIPVNL